jgi:opacity protein-like surface antigen
MHTLLLASVPLVLQPSTAPAVHAVSNEQTPGIPIVQPDLSQASPPLTAGQGTDPLPKRYPYASIQAGIGFPNNLNGQFTLVNFPQIPPVKNSLNLNTGFNGELAVGYKFPDFRTDLSFGYSSFGNQTQTLTFTNAKGQTLGLAVPGKDNVELFTVMANAYYDVKIKNRNGTLSRWSPYIGAGIGLGNLSAPSCAITNCTTFSGGNGSTFAYQGKLGLSYRATTSGFAFLEGGYLGTSSSNIGSVNYDPFGTWRLNLGWRQKL